MKTLSTFILILFLWSLPVWSQDWTKIPGLAETSFTALATIDNVLFAGSGNQLYYSYDQGEHWQQTTIATEFLEPGCFKKFGNRLYIGMHGQGIFRRHWIIRKALGHNISARWKSVLLPNIKTRFMFQHSVTVSGN